MAGKFAKYSLYGFVLLSLGAIMAAAILKDMRKYDKPSGQTVEKGSAQSNSLSAKYNKNKMMSKAAKPLGPILDITPRGAQKFGKELLDISNKSTGKEKKRISIFRVNEGSSSHIIEIQERFDSYGLAFERIVLAGDRLSVRLSPKASPALIDKTIKAIGGQLEDAALGDGWKNVVFTGGKVNDLTRVYAALKASGAFMLVAKVEYQQLEGAQTSPLFDFPVGQWHLQNTGASCVRQIRPARQGLAVRKNGTAGADMAALDAWKLSMDVPDLGPALDCSAIEVAVVDTGVDVGHPDLQDNLVAGYAAESIREFAWGTSYTGRDGIDSKWRDENGHGTHVAGIIAAVGNNSIGTAGVCWKARVVPLRVCGTSGCPTDAITQALWWIYNNKPEVKVINISLTGSTFYEPYYEAIKALRSHGVIIVASAGNGDATGAPVNIDVTPVFPASFANIENFVGVDSVPASLFNGSPLQNLDNIVPVAAINCDGNLWTGVDHSSNYGPKTVKIKAPGDAILSSIARRLANDSGEYADTKQYEVMSGTSQSAPMVSGALTYFLSRTANLGVNYLDTISALYASTTQQNLNLHKFLLSSKTTNQLNVSLNSVGTSEGVFQPLSDANILKVVGDVQIYRTWNGKLAEIKMEQGNCDTCYVLSVSPLEIEDSPTRITLTAP